MAFLLSSLGKFQGKGIHKEIAVGTRITSITKSDNRMRGLVTNASIELENWENVCSALRFLDESYHNVYIKLKVLLPNAETSQ